MPGYGKFRPVSFHNIRIDNCLNFCEALIDEAHIFVKKGRYMKGLIFALLLTLPFHLHASDLENSNGQLVHLPTAGGFEIEMDEIGEEKTPKSDVVDILEDSGFQRLYQLLTVIHEKLAARHPNFNNPNNDGALPLWHQSIPIDHLQHLWERLNHEEQNNLIHFFRRFERMLTAQNDLVMWHDAEMMWFRLAIGVTAATVVVGVAIIFFLSWFEFFQFSCVDTVCDDPQMIETKIKTLPDEYYNSHYCTPNGTATTCLLYQRDVLGYHDLSGSLYEPGCAEDLDPSLVGTPIPLGTYGKVFNEKCQILVGLIPAYPLPFLSIPLVFIIAKIVDTETNLHFCKKAIKNIYTEEDIILAASLNRSLTILNQEQQPGALYLQNMCGSIGSYFHLVPTCLYDGPDVFENDGIYRRACLAFSRSWYNDFFRALGDCISSLQTI